MKAAKKTSQFRSFTPSGIERLNRILGGIENSIIAHRDMKQKFETPPENGVGEADLPVGPGGGSAADRGAPNRAPAPHGCESQMGPPGRFDRAARAITPGQGWAGHAQRGRGRDGA